MGPRAILLQIEFGLFLEKNAISIDFKGLFLLLLN
jgi:hypothetical protein